MALKRLSSLLFGILICTPAISWGFSLERTETYVQKAIQQRLWEDWQWQRLGHWNQNFHSRLFGAFFLSPRGADSPKDELIATLQAFFNDQIIPSRNGFDKKIHPQCQYLARRKWVMEHLEISPDDLMPCQDQDNWKKKVNFKSIYIVFASSDVSSVSSVFGHTFLRLHNPENISSLDLIDYGLNYSAKTGDDKEDALYALKGLFGYYVGTFDMQPFHQKLREYTNVEGRDVWEYSLRFETPQVEFLIDHMLELEQVGQEYYFLSQNCSRQIIELLGVADERIKVQHFPFEVIPLDTVKYLQSLHFLEKGRLRLSLQQRFLESFQTLSFHQQWKLRQSLTNKTVLDSPKELQTQINYLAMQQGSGKSIDADYQLQLLRRRAELGQLPDEKQNELQNPDSHHRRNEELQLVDPIESHDSRGLSVSRFDYSRPEWSLWWRPAFHDRFEQSMGLLPYSHLEVFSFDLRLREGTDQGSSWDLREWVPLKILSNQQINLLTFPKTWKIYTSLFRGEPRVELGLGFSFGDSRARFSVIPQVTYRGAARNSQSRTGIGVHALLGISLASSYRLVLEHNEPFVFAGIVYSEGAWDFRLGANRDDQNSGVSIAITKSYSL
jgi:hypothetical protein